MPSRASPIPKLTVVTVFPTPPFWLQIAMHKTVCAPPGGPQHPAHRAPGFWRLFALQLLPGPVQLILPRLHAELGLADFLLFAFHAEFRFFGFGPLAGLRFFLLRLAATPALGLILRGGRFFLGGLSLFGGGLFLRGRGGRLFRFGRLVFFHLRTFRRPALRHQLFNLLSFHIHSTFRCYTTLKKGELQWQHY